MRRARNSGVAAVVTAAVALMLAALAVAGTIVGTDRGETIRGTAKADVIDGKGGNDTVYGLGGNDRINGGAGRDRIFCGAGADRVEADPTDVVAADCEVRTLSKAGLAAALNRLCLTRVAKNEKLNVRTLADIAARGGEILAISQAMVADMKKLVPPARLEATLQKLVATFEQEIAFLERVVQAAKDGDQKRFDALVDGEERERLSADIENLAGEAIGAWDCP